MKHLYFVLTNRCNEVCRICPRSGSERIRDVDTAVILKKLKRDISEEAVTDITLSGGEPTLHQGLPEVLTLLDEMNIKVTVLSNALRFSNMELAERCFGGLKNKKNFRIVSAVHSLQDGRHDEVTGVKGSLEKTVSGLQNVHSLGISVYVKCIIGAHNKDELENYVEWTNRVFQNEGGLILCGMDYAGMSPDQIGQYGYNIIEITEQLEKALDKREALCAQGKGIAVRVSELPLCISDPYYWKYFDLRIDQDSRYDDSHWENQKTAVRDYYPMAAVCKQCKAQKLCPGIWRTQYEKYGEAAVRPYA